MNKSLLASLSSYSLIKDKKYDEALKVIEQIAGDSKESKLILLKTHVLLLKKDQTQAIKVLADHVMDVNAHKSALEMAVLFSLTLRFAKNYKLMDLIEGFIGFCIEPFSKHIEKASA